MASNLVSHVVKQFDGSSGITEEKPTLVPSDWNLKDTKAKKIIIDRITASHLELIMYKSTAKETIDELSRIYSRKDALKNCSSAKRKLLGLSFKEDGSPAQHLAVFEATDQQT